MNAKINLTYCGMEGSGRTVKEAKQDAARKIESFIEECRTPRILSAGDYSVLIWRDANGWHYGFIRDEVNGISSSHSKEACEQSARRHLGQLATNWRTCITADDVHPIVKDERDRREIATDCQWQRDYHAARERGLDDNDARAFIGGFTQFMSEAGKQLVA